MTFFFLYRFLLLNPNLHSVSHEGSRSLEGCQMAISASDALFRYSITHLKLLPSLLLVLRTIGLQKTLRILKYSFEPSSEPGSGLPSIDMLKIAKNLVYWLTFLVFFLPRKSDCPVRLVWRQNFKWISLESHTLLYPGSIIMKIM